MIPVAGSSPVDGAGVTCCSAIDFSGATRTNPPAIGANNSSATIVATPTASPGAGTYSSTQNVTLSTATGGATICYTTDGTTPAATTPGTCSHGTTYSTAITVSTTTTIEALGTLSGGVNSGVLTAVYTIAPAAPSNLRIQGIPTMKGITIK
jgi:Chitobiase/beta-hexosaminidase C-terminal domain